MKPTVTNREARRIAIGMLVIGVALLLAATLLRRGARIGAPERPLVLVISPAHGTPELAKRLETELARRSGLSLRVVAATSEEDALERAAVADAGLVPLFEYLLLDAEYGVDARLRVLRAGGAGTYAGVLLVRADATETDVAALAGKRVAYVDRFSTTGYLLAARAFADAGVEVEPVFAGSHDAAVAELAAGRVAAAATYDDPAREGVRVLARTGEVPNEPVFFHPRVPEATRARLAAAFVDLAATPEGRALLAEATDITGFEPVTDAEYAGVRDLLAAAQQRIVDLVPGGVELVERYRLSPGGL